MVHFLVSHAYIDRLDKHFCWWCSFDTLDYYYVIVVNEHRATFFFDEHLSTSTRTTHLDGSRP